MNITVLGLTNPDVNLKRMHQLYNVVKPNAVFIHVATQMCPIETYLTVYPLSGPQGFWGSGEKGLFSGSW